MEILQSGLGPLIQLPDINAFREWNRNKPKGLIDKRMTEAEAVSRFIHDNDCIGTELYGTVRCTMSLVNEIVRQGKKDLRIAGQGVLELDMLLAASLVKSLDITYIGLEVYCVSNCLRREVESGRVSCVEWSNASIAWRFKAAAMGIPFIPTRSNLGTDTFKYSAAKVVKDPFTGDPVCLLPALILDTGIIHVHRADKYGNCQIYGISGFAHEMSRASKNLIITAEEIVDTEVIRAGLTAPSSPTIWWMQLLKRLLALTLARCATFISGMKSKSKNGYRLPRNRKLLRLILISISMGSRIIRNILTSSVENVWQD